MHWSEWCIAAIHFTSTATSSAFVKHCNKQFKQIIKEQNKQYNEQKQFVNPFMYGFCFNMISRNKKCVTAKQRTVHINTSFTVVHNCSQLFTVVHSCSQLFTIVHVNTSFRLFLCVFPPRLHWVMVRDQRNTPLEREKAKSFNFIDIVWHEDDDYYHRWLDRKVKWISFAMW